MQLRSPLLSLALLLSMGPGCSSSTFSDSPRPESTQPAEPKPANPKALDNTSQDTEKPVSGEECKTGQNILEVDLLTETVKRDSEDATIAYRLSLQNCEGESLAITDATIKFDINGKYEVLKPLDYRVISTDDNLIEKGTLEVVTGEDLFGNIGTGYGYYKTEALSLESAQNTLILEIDYSYQSHHKVDKSFQEELETFVRVSDSKAVTRNITFLPK